MTIVPHALVGASTAIFTNNIYVAFLVGLISHFILDGLPHLEPSSLVTNNPDGTKHWSIWVYVFVAAELLISITFFYFLRQRADFNLLLAGAAGGILPDLIINNPFLQFLHDKPVIKYFFRFHGKIHLPDEKNHWYWALPVEIIIIGGSLWLLLKF